MIATPRQLTASKETLEQLRAEEAASTDDLDRRTYRALAEDVAAQIRDYEDTAAGRVSTCPVACSDDLGPALVRARIARGWSQTQLADALGVSVPAVERDEDREYEGCGLARFAEILDVLGFELVGTLRLKAARAE